MRPAVALEKAETQVKLWRMFCPICLRGGVNVIPSRPPGAQGSRQQVWSAEHCSLCGASGHRLAFLISHDFWLTDFLRDVSDPSMLRRTIDQELLLLELEEPEKMRDIRLWRRKRDQAREAELSKNRSSREANSSAVVMSDTVGYETSGQPSPATAVPGSLDYGPLHRMSNCYGQQQLFLICGGEWTKVKKTEFHIGRASDADLTIMDFSISRWHCRIVHRPEGYTIEDMGSTNGLFWQGKEQKRCVTDQLIFNGDVYLLGNFELACQLIGAG